MAQDPLVRLVDPHATRLQMGRRDPSVVAGHAVWTEARARLESRLSYIRLPDGERLDYGAGQLGKALDHRAASLAAIVSVGLFAYLSDIRATLAYWAPLLKPHGLLMFASLGPESFHTLALALDDPARRRHIPGHPDMHDLGDALIHCGFSDPVMDAERLRFAYGSPQAALADLRALGGNSLLARPAGLSPRSWANRVLQALEGLREDGAIMLPVELVFGHAWASPPRPAKQQTQPVQWVGRHAKNSPSGI